MNNFKARPLQDRIIVKPLDSEKKTQSGIIIPDNSKEKPLEGKVIALGKGTRLEDGTYKKIDVEIGNIVVFGKYSGIEIKVENEDYLVIKEDDLLCVKL